MKEVKEQMVANMEGYPFLSAPKWTNRVTPAWDSAHESLYMKGRIIDFPSRGIVSRALGFSDAEVASFVEAEWHNYCHTPVTGVLPAPKWTTLAELRGTILQMSAKRVIQTHRGKKPDPGIHLSAATTAVLAEALGEIPALASHPIVVWGKAAMLPDPTTLPTHPAIVAGQWDDAVAAFEALTPWQQAARTDGTYSFCRPGTTCLAVKGGGLYGTALNGEFRQTPGGGDHMGDDFSQWVGK